MISKIISYFAGATARRWLIGAGIGILVVSAGVAWHNIKNNLRDEGASECIQVINEQTVIDLQNALAHERLAAAELRATAVAAAAVNTAAKQRLAESTSVIADLQRAMKEQEEKDETYKEWRNSALPGGVSERLRSIGAGVNSNTGDRDSN